MKKIIFALFSAWAVLPVFAQQWNVRGPLPTPRSGLGMTIFNNKIYAIGGTNGTFLTKNERYSLLTNGWDLLSPMTVGRSEMGVVTVGGKIYVIGGYNLNGAESAVEAYDPLTDLWSTKTPMPTPRARPSVCVINNKIYVVGGWSPQSSALEIYDPATDTWTTKAPLPGGVIQNNSAIAYNNHFYIFGGKDSSETQVLDSVHIYNPVTDIWSVAANMPQPVYSGAAALLNNKIHYFGGSPDIAAMPHLYDTHYIYDPVTNTWTTGLPMPEKRSMHAAAVLNNKIYIVGGIIDSNGTVTGLNEEYSEPGLNAGAVIRNSSMVFYPNPVNDALVVESAGMKASSRIAITDLDGNVVAAHTFRGNKFVISTAAISSGVYLVILDDGATITAEKLVITH